MPSSKFLLRSFRAFITGTVIAAAVMASVAVGPIAAQDVQTKIENTDPAQRLAWFDQHMAMKAETRNALDGEKRAARKPGERPGSHRNGLGHAKVDRDAQATDSLVAVRPGDHPGFRCHVGPRPVDLPDHA